MVHKTISAANELRAPPLAQWKRPKLVNHSRKVGIEQFRIRQALMARARSFNSPCPPMTNKRVCTRVNVRWVDGWAVSSLYADGVVLIGTGAKGSTCASHRGICLFPWWFIAGILSDCWRWIPKAWAAFVKCHS